MKPGSPNAANNRFVFLRQCCFFLSTIQILVHIAHITHLQRDHRADDAVVTLGGLQPELILDHPAGGGHTHGKAQQHLFARVSFGKKIGLLNRSARRGHTHGKAQQHLCAHTSIR